VPHLLWHGTGFFGLIRSPYDTQGDVEDLF
jgi:hypothetical protein